MHWFDFLASLGVRADLGLRARARAAGQAVAPAAARRRRIVAFDGGQAALAFDGAARFGAADRTVVGGSAGTLVSAARTSATRR